MECWIHGSGPGPLTRPASHPHLQHAALGGRAQACAGQQRAPPLRRPLFQQLSRSLPAQLEKVLMVGERRVGFKGHGLRQRSRGMAAWLHSSSGARGRPASAPARRMPSPWPAAGRTSKNSRSMPACSRPSPRSSPTRSASAGQRSASAACRYALHTSSTGATCQCACAGHSLSTGTNTAEVCSGGLASLRGSWAPHLPASMLPPAAGQVACWGPGWRCQRPAPQPAAARRGAPTPAGP